MPDEDYEPDFLVGDVVERMNAQGECVAAIVIGFCPSDKWIRVRSDDGIRRIWLKENVSNIDDMLRQQGLKGA